MRIDLKQLERLNKLIKTQEVPPDKVYVEENEICLIWIQK